jgi:hypothetical protein
MAYRFLTRETLGHLACSIDMAATYCYLGPTLKLHLGGHKFKGYSVIKTCDTLADDAGY